MCIRMYDDAFAVEMVCYVTSPRVLSKPDTHPPPPSPLPPLPGSKSWQIEVINFFLFLNFF